MDFLCGGKCNASLLTDKLATRSSSRQILVDRSFCCFLGLGIVSEELSVKHRVALSQSTAEIHRNTSKIAADVESDV